MASKLNLKFGLKISLMLTTFVFMIKICSTLHKACIWGVSIVNIESMVNIGGVPDFLE